MTKYEVIKHLVKKYNAGEIDYDELKRRAKPFITAINDKNREIAKKHNMKPKLINLPSIMRNLY